MANTFMRFCIILFFILVGNSFLKAQTVVTIDSLEINEFIYLTLPPLDVLFENAKTAPTYELAVAQEMVEKSLLRKEKKAWLGFFSIRGSWQYGKFNNDATYSDVYTPIINTYNSSAQHAYTVGAAVNIKLDDLFDLGGKVKRQKLQVRSAELMKEQSYELVKKEIVQLYASVKAQLNILKLRAESVTLTNNQYRIMEKHFANGTITSDELANQKENQTTSIQRYEDTKYELNKSLMVLEIITNTTIVRR